MTRASLHAAITQALELLAQNEDDLNALELLASLKLQIGELASAATP